MVRSLPNDSSEYRDTDGDGVGDNDAFPITDESKDSDNDGVGDNDNDDDNDGVDIRTMLSLTRADPRRVQIRH